ncbi:MAG: hypothetical protein RBS16_09410 [Candidatus Cloacimonadales bacterium]|jgi:hypothetical protein|nr:hypothetical protein [Candidatus Cloacimonadota bacterium]MDX9978229.1 hypothetical protein [Candidatus Cloacimonadales bacterium]
MKKSLIVLIIVVFAICLLSADIVTVQASRDIPGQIRGYVYQSYYPDHSCIPQWRAKVGEVVKIVVKNTNGQIIYSETIVTGIDGFYDTSETISTTNNYTVFVTCHGVTKSASVQYVNRFDFYIDREF